MFNLGNLERELGRTDEARGWYERAMATGHPKVASLARQKLDSLRRHQEDLRRAKNFTEYGSAYIGTDHRRGSAETNSTPEGPKDEAS
jgi:hypothetical protein